jgi:anti-sigma B factor antagonist
VPLDPIREEAYPSARLRESMIVHFDEIDGVLVVVPEVKQLDCVTATSFRDQILDRVAGKDRVVLALRHVKYMDSTGIACLVHMIKRMPAGGQLRLAEVDARVHTLLKLTRLDRIFPAFADVDGAVKG